MENQLALISSQFLWIYPDQEQFLWQLFGNRAKKETPKIYVSKRKTTILCDTINYQSTFQLQSAERKQERISEHAKQYFKKAI